MTVLQKKDNGYNHQIVNTVIWYPNTVIFLSFQTDRSGQTVQTQIRLLRGAV